MKKACEKDKITILNFLRKDIANALYMYIDIKKYGLLNENVDVWYEDKTNCLSTVIMRYHNSITIYSKDSSLIFDDVLSIINNYNVTIVNGNYESITNFAKYLKKEVDSIGYVFKLYACSNGYYSDVRIEKPKKEDFDEIARLICDDKTFNKLYNINEIKTQLLSRLNDGFGRNYIIKDQNKIIGHIATYAEFDGIAITSGLVVDKNYQNGIYGAMLERYLINTLIDENFEVYTFVTNRIRKKYLEVNKNKLVGYYSRIIL